MKPDAKQFASPGDWELHKPTIKRLYLDEDRTLPRVRQIMETEHNFHAT